MTEGVRNCFTWFANAAAKPVLYESWSDEFRLKSLREAYKNFIEFLSNRIDFNSLTREEAKELRFCRWDDDSDLYLIPLYLVPAIPVGTELTTISGEKVVYEGVDSIDLDTRFGCLAYGITIGGETQ